jgi:lipid-A-disaccharide synthase-like uncharacterized protein
MRRDRRRAAALAPIAAFVRIVAFVLIAALAAPLDAQTPASAERPAPTLDLQQRVKDLRVKDTPQGERVTVEVDDRDVELTPEEFVHALRTTKDNVEHGGALYRLLNISKPFGLVWISVGLLGQAMFTFRMLLQWWASEKHKRSVVPVGFWWGSLIGGVMLFAYFCWRKDAIGILGQSTGVFIYARNLVLIYRGQRIEAEGARVLDEGESSPQDSRPHVTT